MNDGFLVHWCKFSDINASDYKNKKCVVFRYDKNKFQVATLSWSLAHPDDKMSGIDCDKWKWVSEHKSCFDVTENDYFFVFPQLKIEKTF